MGGDITRSKSGSNCVSRRFRFASQQKDGLTRKPSFL